MTLHALTVDLEDWHQLLRRRVTGATTPASTHVVADTHRLLDLLDVTGVRATFFVVGMVAESYPELVREVANRRHEVGSHTYNHELIHHLEPGTFRSDVDRSRKQLQDLSGQPVLGFSGAGVLGGGARALSFRARLAAVSGSVAHPLRGPAQPGDRHLEPALAIASQTVHLRTIGRALPSVPGR